MSHLKLEINLANNLECVLESQILLIQRHIWSSGLVADKHYTMTYMKSIKT